MAFVTDPDSERTIKDCIAGQSVDGTVMRGGISRAIDHLAAERSPETLIVDLSGVEMPVSLVQILADECEPGVTVIAIGDRDEVGLYRDLLHAGVADYLVKPLNTQLIAKSLHLSINPEPGSQISQKLGKMITFVGARGGVGTTTLAASLAMHLADEQNRRVALVDLDLQNGDCGLMLNIKPTSGLRDALENPLRIDATLVERAMTAYGERLFVLSCEEPLTDQIDLTVDAVESIISVLRPRFHYVIVDTPRIPMQAYHRVLELADLRVIVADQTLHATRDAIRLRRLLGDGDKEHKNVLVLNRCGETGRDSVTPDEVGNTVQLKAKVMIPYQPKLFARALAEGRPPAVKSGAFAAAIEALGAELSGRPAKRRGFWGAGR